MSSKDLKPHLILFDCDGTLTDSHGAIVLAMQSAFKSCGLNEPGHAEVEGVIGLSLTGAIERLSNNAEHIPNIARAYREHYVAAEASLALYPGVVETLEELRYRGYWMAIVTGKSKQGLLRVLEQFALGDYFYAIRTADCCPSKPHPAMAVECMEELGADADGTTLVGDALFDMQMATAANVKAIGVSFGVEDADALYDCGAEHVVDSFSQLLEHFPPLKSDAVTATIRQQGER